jgi:lysophospholipase L1-like esterase
MKQFILALGATLFAFTVSAQTNAPSIPLSAAPSASAPAAAPQAETVSPSNPDNTRYISNPALTAGCEKQLASFNDKPCDIIFIGDSITENWLKQGKAVWDKVYAPRHALDFGVSGDTTQNVLWRLNNMSVQSLKPKVAVLLIGTNNTMNNPHEIADGINAILANTQEAFPGVKIILVSIMPNVRANDTMMQTNSIIKGYADKSTVYYLDLVPLMPSITKTLPDGNLDTNWKGLSSDHLHPDASGYQIWADAMEPLLSKLLAGG